MAAAPTERRQVENGPQVVEPVLENDLPIEITGDRVRIVFDRAMARPPAANAPAARIPAAPGTLTLSPETKGRAEWLDAFTLEWRASLPLAVAERYKVTLGELRSLAGEAMASGWHMTAIPRVVIAEKILSYSPKPGQPRVVAIHPHDGVRVGRRPEIAVLYDQPMDLWRAQSLLSIENDKGIKVPFDASHPPGPTFQGVEVDRRFVVVLKPVAALAQGEGYRLRAKAAYPDGAGEARLFRVAAPLALTSVECPSWATQGCSVSGNTVQTPGTTIAIRVNNPLAGNDRNLEKLVRVSPPVRNLSVYREGWADGRLVVSAAFEPSGRYDVTVMGLEDRFGSRLEKPFRAVVERAPEDASVTMASGVLLLDAEQMKHFVITSRNVDTALLSFWNVEDSALGHAVTAVRAGHTPQIAPEVGLEVAVAARENALVQTTVDLTKQLDAGRRYLATVAVKDAAFGSDMPLERGPQPVALVFPGSRESLAIHVEKLATETLVHVARLGSGEPVGGAAVELLERGNGPGAASLRTDASGFALLAPEATGWLSVTAGGARALLDLQRPDTTTARLFPSLAAGSEADAADVRSVLFTDRGIYRPGASVRLFANLRKPAGSGLAPVAERNVVVRAVGPSGDEVFRTEATTNELGSLSAVIELAKTAKLGRHRLLVTAAEDERTSLAEAIVQVADFEPPRFAVDVDATATDRRELHAEVRARYLFGAAMAGAAVKWTARREAAAIAEGPFAGAGFGFRPVRESWDERPRAAWSRAGELVAGADGVAKIDQHLSLEGTVGPQRFVVEAEVTDSSHRAIAGRGAAVVHSAERYAGVRVARRWVATGERLAVDLAVVDREGKAVSGASVAAVLRRVDYSSVARRDAGGALSYEWTRSTTAAGRCSATSATVAASCELTLPVEGNYEIAAELDGRSGGSTTVWAWRENARGGAKIPSRGRAIELVPDRATYAPGQVAKLFVTSPFEAATAIVATDAPGSKPRTQRIEGSAGVVEIPITAEHAPHVHAMVTLLPLSGAGHAPADYRIGAVRLPVAVDNVRLGLAVTPAKTSYRPGEEAEIALQLDDGGSPSRGAEIAIAVVDEGVLRLTGFHAPDPVLDLRPGRAFSAEIFDTRAGLAELVAQSHVAGDGDDSPGPSTRGRRGDTERSLTSARKTFQDTAFWKPDVRTDEHGKATVRFRLPDNLTEMRVMAVALDADGKGAVAETSFTVTKPMLLVPALPRFVAPGDSFDAATLVHNNTDTAALVKVSLGDRVRRLLVPARGKVRVGFPVRIACEDDAADHDDQDAADDPADASDDEARELALCPTSQNGEPAKITARFMVRDEDGEPLDAVELQVPAAAAGLEERPRLEGAFAGSRKIALSVPKNISTRAGQEALVLQLGAQMWPELGERMRYLLEYPHGCVEQTTSSTLPLLAARDIAPRIGMANVSDADLRLKIRAGIDRLATMRTPGGGLAYWPGGGDPNVYGTAYAMRALVLARAAGIEPPKDLLDGMATYLAHSLFGLGMEPEVQAAIAQSLADLGRLEPSAADPLYDRHGEQTVFGAASLALALATLPGQDDRVAALLDQVEAGLDEGGGLRKPPGTNDFHYYGSPGRTKAQAAMALRRLRPLSPVLPGLVRALSGLTGSYTTQATAYSLLALAEELRALPPGAEDVQVLLDGRAIENSRELPGGGREFSIPLADLAGKEASLELRSGSDEAIGFLLRAQWQRPPQASDEAAEAAFHTAHGPSVYRVYTDAKGGPVDLAGVRAGDVVRVALLVRRPEAVEPERYGYLAITDRLPAGFEPVQTDLATVSAQPELGDSHPLAAWFRQADERASFVELHDDRVNVYFDTLSGDDVVASYLMRATTPGRFTIPPAVAELMYEPDSLGATEAGRVVVR